MSIQKLVVLWLYFREDRNCLVAMAFLDLPPDLRLPSRNAQVRLESLLAQHSQPATYYEQPAFKKKSRLFFTPTPSHGHCDSHVNMETPYEKLPPSRPGQRLLPTSFTPNREQPSGCSAEAWLRGPTHETSGWQPTFWLSTGLHGYRVDTGFILTWSWFTSSEFQIQSQSFGARIHSPLAKRECVFLKQWDLESLLKSLKRHLDIK